MRKKYNGLGVIKIDYYDSFQTQEQPPVATTCFYIVADTVTGDDHVCSNPSGSTVYRWYGDAPDFPD